MWYILFDFWLFQQMFFIGLNKLIKAINPLPDDKILDWSKLKQIADYILKWI